jgi:hypothetical protein
VQILIDQVFLPEDPSQSLDDLGIETTDDDAFLNDSGLDDIIFGDLESDEE